MLLFMVGTAAAQSLAEPAATPKAASSAAAAAKDGSVGPLAVAQLGQLLGWIQAYKSCGLAVAEDVLRHELGVHDPADLMRLPDRNSHDIRVSMRVPEAQARGASAVLLLRLAAAPRPTAPRISRVDALLREHALLRRFAGLLCDEEAALQRDVEGMTLFNAPARTALLQRAGEQATALPRLWLVDWPPSLPADQCGSAGKEASCSWDAAQVGWAGCMRPGSSWTA
jgi:hypothetical protein